MYKPFRAALEGLREQFAYAANRHPAVFFEKATIPSPSDPDWNLKAVCQAFIEANRREDGQEEWHVWKSRETCWFCGRLYGSLAGIEEFKRLTETLNLVLREMNEVVGDEQYEHIGCWDCLELMETTAQCYPMPFLRVKHLTWGVTEASADFWGDLHFREQVSPSTEDSPPYPLHPYCRRFAQNVFLSAVAFIDAILSPDRTLLFRTTPGDYFADTKRLRAGVFRVLPGRDPVSLPTLPEGDEGERTTTEEEKTEGRYVLRRQGTAWSVYFEDEEAAFGGRRKFVPIAKLLREPGREMDALELIREGVDVEREERAKQAQSEAPDKPQAGGRDPALDSKATRAGMEEMERLMEEIQMVMREPGLDMLEKVEAMTGELIRGYRVLNQATRDQAVIEEKQSLDDQGTEMEEETLSDLAEQIEDLLARILEARKRHDGKKVEELREELLERIFRWIETWHDKEKMVRRRSRPLGTPDPEERARYTVDRSIQRAKKDIAEKMPHCGKYLRETIGQVADDAKWVYKGKILWKVEGI